MKRLLMMFFLILSTTCFADQPTQPPTLAEWFRAEVKQHDGMIYWRIPIGDMNWCFTRSTDEIVSISDEWQSLAGMAIKTVPLSVKEFQVCTDTLPPVIWVVAVNPVAKDTPPTRPLKDNNMVNRWRISTGMPCEAVTLNVIKAGGQEYHYATNTEGQRGITVCERK